MIERSGRSHRQFGHFGANYSGARFMLDETGDGQLVALNQDGLSFVRLKQFSGDCKEICQDIRAGG